MLSQSKPAPLLLRVVHKKPGEAPEVLQIPDTLEAIQGLVGGYLELVRCELPDGTEVDLWCNEEGLLRALEPNVLLNDEVIFGPVFVSRSRGDEMIALTEREADAVCEWFRALERAARSFARWTDPSRTQH